MRPRARSALVPGQRRRQQAIQGMQDPSLEPTGEGIATAFGDTVQVQEYVGRRSFTVPNYSVVRPVMDTPELRHFHTWLDAYFAGTRYRVPALDRLFMKILPRKELVDSFVAADVQPAPGEMYEVAQSTAEEIGQRILRCRPRRINMTPGQVGSFRHDGSVLGVTPHGWVGYKKRYPAKGPKNSPNINFYLRNEANIAVGSISNAFGEGINSHGEATSVDFSPIQGLTPHIPLAYRRGGQAIPPEDLEEHAAAIQAKLPEIFPLFDPVVDLDLDLGGPFMVAPDEPAPPYLLARDQKSGFPDVPYLQAA